MLRTTAALVAGICLLSSLAFAAEEPQPRTISTTGESTVYVAPDEVIVNLGVETFSQDLGQAQAANARDCQRLLAAIKALDVPDKQIQTSNLEVELRYKESSRPTYGIEGYFARRSYAVTLKDPKLLEKLVDAALKNGANRLMGFQFRTTELRKHRDQARKMAIQAAKEKALALAAELNCKVGAPRTINEGGAGYSGYAGSSWGWNRNVSLQNSAQVVGEAGEGGETLPLGQIGISANVSVTFDLIP